MTAEGIVLIIDDDVVVRLTAAAVLKRAGIASRAVGSGEEALEYLTAESNPAVVLCDYFLPAMSGDEVVRQIRSVAAWKEIPVILLTGRAMGPEWESAKELCEAAITKPFSADELTTQVKRLLGSDEERVA